MKMGLVVSNSALFERGKRTTTRRNEMLATFLAPTGSKSRLHCTRNCRSKSEKQRAGCLAPVPDRPAGAAYAPQPSPESEWWSGCTHQPRKGSAGPQGGGSNSTLEFDSRSRIFPTRPNGRACCRARHVRLLSRPGRWCGRTHTTTTRTWLGSTLPPARAQCCSSTTGWTAPAPTTGTQTTSKPKRGAATATPATPAIPAGQGACSPLSHLCVCCSCRQASAHTLH